MSRIVFLDLETTGLDPARHEVWEIGLIDTSLYSTPRSDIMFMTMSEAHLWRIYPDLAKADPAALTKNQFYRVTENTRTPGDGNVQTGHVCDLAADACPQLKHMIGEDRHFHWSPAPVVAETLARILDGAVVVGANPSFDRDFLRPFLAANGHAYTAHYRPICITAVGFGFLYGRHGRPGDIAAVPDLDWPLSSDQVSRALGVDPDKYERHTALGDAAWVRAQWDAIIGGGHA
ncbi:hypothetical protein [Actinomadura decatromicini]|uniref:Exonuclease domain-containing protein n=1 Tax=Actinomadura decatromicini TaxID=2604572 RepID=A0A5D3F7U2_9ACTN|nr:hypothetical protein [Actinomadura decatromicini]TYK45087.1 hypothetical protein FXF68_30870 [Actinomadura decatromicini]